MVEIFYEETEDLGLSPDFFVEWYNKLCDKYNKRLGDVTLIYCSDNYLLEMNQQHLSHDFFTDIITFDYCVEGLIAGDLFISVDRVKENAETHAVSFEDELHRVSAHGVLHLMGFKDKTDEDSLRMTAAEDDALALRFT